MKYCNKSGFEEPAHSSIKLHCPIICIYGFQISSHKNCCGKKASQGYKQQQRDLNNLSKLHGIIGCRALCMISRSGSFPCCQSFDSLPDIRQRSNRYRRLGSCSREEWAEKSNTISSKLPKNQQINVWLLNLLNREYTELVQWEWFIFSFLCTFKLFFWSFFSFEGILFCF